MNLINKFLSGNFWDQLARLVRLADNQKKDDNASSDEPAVNEAAYRLMYRFIDASVPPEYHRSYTITVTPGNIHRSVDSYGKILSEKDWACTQDNYQHLVASLLSLTITSRAEVFSEGCTGGTTDVLDIDIPGKKTIKGRMYYCGGKTFGTLEGNVAGAASLFTALIPDLQKRR